MKKLLLLLFFTIGNIISQNTFNPDEVSVKSMIEQHTLFINSNGTEGQKLIANNINFKGVYIRVKNLEGAEFTNCNFSYSSIYNSKLNNTIFSDCNFSNSQMWSTDFENAVITNCNFENIEWKECNFIDTEIKECITTNSNFYKSTFENTELIGRQEELSISNLNNNFSETILDGSSFTNFNLNNYDFSNSDFLDVAFYECKSTLFNLETLKSVNNIKFSTCKIDKLIGKKSNINRFEIINNSEFLYCDIGYSILLKVKLLNSKIKGNFDASTMENSLIRNCDLTESVFNSTKFRNSEIRLNNFKDVLFLFVNLSSVDFSGNDIQHIMSYKPRNTSNTNVSGCIWTDGRICSSESLSGVCK